MKVPLSWLGEFVDITLQIDELVHRLNMSGTEVEDVVAIGSEWDQIFVARIVELRQHPNADSLFVARLDVGSHGVVTVVTGAKNVHVGASVPLVRPGGRLPGGRQITSETFRGVSSEGMLCSGDELGLTPDRSGIYLLDGDAEVGRPLRDTLGETVLDLYITPNRPDCMSVFGIAREVHVLTGAPLRPISTTAPRGERSASDLIRVEIVDPDLCRRFTAAWIGDVSVRPSPSWLQRRLHLAGVRPINNVVDATNYTMLELGQPQHAFDADLLGDTILVRQAAHGERLVTLDGVERELAGDMLVIADAVNPVSIAGVMGGASTEVSDTTRNVVLETANFAPSSIRRTSRASRLASEASRRFERGLDPELALMASQRTTRLLVDLCEGTSADGIVDVYPGRPEPRQVMVHEDQVSALLGRSYSRSQISEVLEALDFSVEEQGERLLVTVPGHRPDVEGRADLAEEVARITGYDALPETLPAGAVPEPMLDPLRTASERSRDVLLGCGLQEVMTYSLVSPDSERALRDGSTAEGVDAGDQPIETANAISADHSVLRTTLLPSLLATAATNLRHQDGVSIFEVARVYIAPLDPLPREPTRLAVALVGKLTPVAWNVPSRDADFFDLKGIVEELLCTFNVGGQFQPASSAEYHPGQCARIMVSGRTIGYLGQLNPLAVERFDLKSRRAYIGEIDLGLLAELAQDQAQIVAPPRFPPTDRDLALVVDRSTAERDVSATLASAGSKLLEEVRLFDLYEGDQLPPGKKSLAYSLRFRSADRTLTDLEVDTAMKDVIAAAIERLGAQVRGQA